MFKKRPVSFCLDNTYYRHAEKSKDPDPLENRNECGHETDWLTKVVEANIHCTLSPMLKKEQLACKKGTVPLGWGNMLNLHVP